MTVPYNRLRYIWNAMRRRCLHETHPYYRHYGGRGITICDEWKENFPAFRTWALENGYADHLELDRHPDNDGNYEPNNCRWTTESQNKRNTRYNVRVAAFGEIKTLVEWTEDPRCVVIYGGLQRRIAAGWDPERAITLVARNGRNKWSSD